MHSFLKQRLEMMRGKLDNRAPVAEIWADSQLFVSPDPVCDRLVELADIDDSDTVLEPSAGTGAILRAVLRAAPAALCDAVELNGALALHLRRSFERVRVHGGDFMEFTPEKRYSKIVMNPPFQHAQDIRHILRALSLLEPGGILAAVCLNGPRQRDKLKPLAEVWEEWPRGTFTYTDVSTVTLKIRG